MREIMIVEIFLFVYPSNFMVLAKKVKKKLIFHLEFCVCTWYVRNERLMYFPIILKKQVFEGVFYHILYGITFIQMEGPLFQKNNVVHLLNSSIPVLTFLQKKKTDGTIFTMKVRYYRYGTCTQNATQMGYVLHFHN